MKDDIVWRELSDIQSKILVKGSTVKFIHSDNITLAYWDFEAGTLLPDHSHPHEQITSIIEGTFELTVGGETKTMKPGSVAVIPPDIRHYAKSVTGCRVIDVFYPVREDYR